MSKPDKDSVHNYVLYIRERIEGASKDSDIAQSWIECETPEIFKSLAYLISAVETLTRVAKLELQLIDYLADYIE